MSFERETKVRDYYASVIQQIRPGERVVARERQYDKSRMRVDLRTVDASNLLREWEFKIFATYEALGQVLVYAHHAIRENPQRQVRGVIAAFEFQPELYATVQGLCLNVDLVTIPRWMAQAGGVPLTSSAVNVVNIPTGF